MNRVLAPTLSRHRVRVEPAALATWAVALFVFSIPFETGVTIPGLGSVTRLMGMFAFAVTVLSLVEDGRLRIRIPSVFLIVVAAYVTWNALTFFWSIDPSRTVSSMVTSAQLAAMVWMVHQLATTDRRRDILAQAFVLGAYASIVVALTIFVASPQPDFRNIGSMDPNRFATGSALAIPVAWGLALRLRSRALFWLNALYPVLAIVAVVLAASRGGLFTSLVALSVVPLAAPRLSPARRTVVLVALILLTWGVFAFAPRAFPELQRNLTRLEAAGDEIESGSLTGRTVIWSAGLEAWQTSPMVGLGSGTFSVAAEEFLGRRRGAHNGYLAVAVGAGVIGLMLFLAVFAAVAAGVASARIRRTESLVLLAALMVALVPLNIEHRQTTWFVLGWLAATSPIMVTLSKTAALRFGASDRGAAPPPSAVAVSYDDGSERLPHTTRQDDR